MKIAIIAFNNLRISPYVNIYADFCRENNIEHEIIYPNRASIQETAQCPLVPIEWDASKNKLINFLKFRKEAIRYLKQKKPDFVIVLTTMPAVLLGGFLCCHFKERYLVDVRDYTYEHVLPYYLMEKKALKNSAMNVISSPGFRNFLPSAEYYLCQNINAGYASGKCDIARRIAEEGITIGYVGSIGYKEQCMRLIHLVEKDNRFRFYLYGDEGPDKRISIYLQSHPCDRIKTFGPYVPSEKSSIMAGVDILFNAYGCGSKLLDYALSNKLYDAFYMRIPLLTSPNTAMSEEAGAYSFDIDLENEASLDRLYEWYRKFDHDAFDTYSEQYLNNVFRKQEAFYTRLRSVLCD